MTKIYGLFGSMTGKLADVVMTVRNGEQIARKYQPKVFNPSTPAQVATRAKLKLLSQLGVVVGPYLPIRRQGAVSARNLFTRYNYRFATYSENAADINLSDITLTNGVVALSGIVATRSGINVTVGLGAADRDVGRVVYLVFRKEVNGDIRYINSTVVSNPGDGYYFQDTVAASSGNLFVLAYGVRDNTEAARVVFGKLVAPTAQEVARVIVSRVLLESDVTLTTTSYAAVTEQAQSESRKVHKE